MYRIVIEPFRLSPAVMISHPMPLLLLALQHPSIDYKGGSPLIGKDGYMFGPVWLAKHLELFYNFLLDLVP